MENGSAAEIGQRLIADLRALHTPTTATVRAVRRRYSAELKAASAALVLDLADHLWVAPALRWVAYELIAAHPGAFACLTARRLEALGMGMASWDAVDSFARTLSGPAWRDGLIGDAVIERWARSPDRWWRRAALVSTVALNMRSQGGAGDVRRTLRICRKLAADPDDMVVKALSWALRELVPHDPAAVEMFLREHAGILAARVKREVRSVLATGLKNPRRRGAAGP
jgi:3-methyladenine DNA glycosylase AlkD